MFINQFFKDLRGQWKYSNWVVVLFIKKIILFKNWSDVRFFQAVRKCISFKRFINAIGQYRKCKLHSFKVFLGISLPTDLLLLRSLINVETKIY